MTLWLKRSGTGQMAHGQVNADSSPCPTIMAEGIGGGNCSQYWIEEDGMLTTMPVQTKPPYQVPSMAEIAAVPWNGLTVASTFSGCGGSCLGYRMAGYRVAWANEFIPRAQDSYRANHATTHLDVRDIRRIHPEDILAVLKMAPGNLDLLDGSPPCASFSTAGNREAGWGKVKPYSETQQRTDDLFFEYARLLKGLQPKAFVAENVSGLVKGVAKGYFKEIFAMLKACGYRVEARLLDAQWLGVPQMRQRIIFVGVRSDLGKAPVFPTPLSYRYSVREALPGITRQASSSFAGEHESFIEIEHANGFNSHAGMSVEVPMSTVQAGRSVKALDRAVHTLIAPSRLVRRKFTIAELKRICAFPDDFQLTGSYVQQWERLGRAVPPVMMAHIAATLRDQLFAKF